MILRSIISSLFFIFVAISANAQEQSTDGNCSPNVIDVEGDVSVNCGTNNPSQKDPSLVLSLLKGLPDEPIALYWEKSVAINAQVVWLMTGIFSLEEVQDIQCSLADNNSPFVLDLKIVDDCTLEVSAPEKPDSIDGNDKHVFEVRVEFCSKSAGLCEREMAEFWVFRD